MADEKWISITKAVGGGALLFLAGAGVGRTTVNGPEINPGGNSANVVYDFGDAGTRFRLVNHNMTIRARNAPVAQEIAVDRFGNVVFHNEAGAF
jgi:hypothetical protein